MKFFTLAALAAVQAKVSVHEVEQFTAGLIYGLVQKDDLKEIEQCMTDGSSLANELDEAIVDFKKKTAVDIIKGIEKVGEMIEQFPQDLGDCKSMQGDIKRIEHWANIFLHPIKLIETIVKNSVKHPKQLTHDLFKFTYDLGAQDFYTMGDDVADMLIITLGPVPPSNSAPESLTIT
eukprot:CAMPEP_0170479686 /NCGR_PEP_ID=MMETSP0208-20121228/826_1 /TAXON_ID=197538 /ORGANISM="Strombidium inclinatum, Strain S3" /LENGTH=176 /DNA_ID=CAMNT_0010752127 /DNA_START=16 /DNA_END=546 /DNA_ORIENTATION=+